VDFQFDLFGEGKKDTSLQGQIKEWVRAHFKVPPEVVVLVTEIYCDMPGCAPIETLVAILDPAGRKQYRSKRPMKEVKKEDIPHLLPNPEGHGPRIDVDRLDGSKWV
jgi:hypothetical protein